MEKELNLGLMGLFIQDNMLMGKKKGMDYLSGLMGLTMKVISLKTIYMGKENILGQIIECIMEIGKITEWKGKGFLLGLMVGNMKGNI